MQNRHNLIGHVFNEVPVNQLFRRGVDEVNHTPPLLLVKLNQTEVSLLVILYSIPYRILLVLRKDDRRVVTQHIVILHVILSSQRQYTTAESAPSAD